MSEKSVISLILTRGLSSLSSLFSTFMLNLWLFDKTHSQTLFIVNTFLLSLIPLFFSLPAGILADKFKKRSILIICDLFTICGFILLIIFSSLDYFHYIPYILIITLITISNEFRFSAMTTLIPEVASKDNLRKYNGIQQIFRGVSIIFAPMLGALSYTLVNITASLFFSIFIQVISLLILIKIPLNPIKTAKKQEQLSYSDAVKWIWQIDFLRRITFSFTLISGVISAYMAILTPYILTTFNPFILAMIISLQGVGVVFSGYLAFKIKATKDHILFQISTLLLGIFIFLIGFCATPAGLYLLAFLIGGNIGIVATANQTLWQKQTPNDIQGRVLAIRTCFLYLLSPLFIYVTLPLTNTFSDFIFEHYNLLNARSPLGITISILGALILIFSLLFLVGTKRKANI